MAINRIERRSTSKRALIIFLVLAALGLALGYWLRSLSDNSPPETPPSTRRANHAPAVMQARFGYRGQLDVLEPMMLGRL